MAKGRSLRRENPANNAVGHLALNLLLEKYATDGELQLLAVHKHLPDVLKMPPISQRGNIDEIICKFGAAERLQLLLYAA